MLRLINDIARDAAMNMAIDEVLFNGLQGSAVLRTYLWDKAHTTIGYFQKNDANAVRRLTGGLLVNHKDDISYGFCADAEKWPFIYSQQDTYKHIHTAIKKALSFIGYDCDFAQIESAAPKNAFCVQTLYSDDLIYKGKKIAGSCVRRRGKKILVQGSVHLDLGAARRSEFAYEFAVNLAEVLKTGVTEQGLTGSEIDKARKLALEKYSSKDWNGKF